MTHRVGTKGQVVIPKHLRDDLGIHPGDEIAFWRDGDQLVLRAVQHRPPLRGRFKGSDLLGDLARARRDDAAREG